jgi:hypothetical protein
MVESERISDNIGFGPVKRSAGNLTDKMEVRMQTMQVMDLRPGNGPWRKAGR